MVVHNGVTGTRISNPFKSAGVLIGWVLLVICRKPLSQNFSKAWRPALSIAPRT